MEEVTLEKLETNVTGIFETSCSLIRRCFCPSLLVNEMYRIILCFCILHGSFCPTWFIQYNQFHPNMAPKRGAPWIFRGRPHLISAMNMETGLREQLLTFEGLEARLSFEQKPLR